MSLNVSFLVLQFNISTSKINGNIMHSGFNQNSPPSQTVQTCNTIIDKRTNDTEITKLLLNAPEIIQLGLKSIC